MRLYRPTPASAATDMDIFLPRHRPKHPPNKEVHETSTRNSRGRRKRQPNVMHTVRRRGIAPPGLAVAFLCLVQGGDAQYDSCNGTVAKIGDGRCDQALNTPNCGWDGGDVSSPLDPVSLLTCTPASACVPRVGRRGYRRLHTRCRLMYQRFFPVALIRARLC